MPLEFKEVAEYLGIDATKINSIDEFKSSFDTDFVRSSAIGEDHPSVKAIMGKRIGSLETGLKRLSGQFGVDWSGEEFKDKSLEDRMKLSMDKVASDHKALLEDFKKTNGGGKEEVIAEWTKKYDKLKNEKAEDALLLSSLKTEYDNTKLAYENEKKNFRINFEKENGLKEFKWKTGTNDFTKRGFMDSLNEKYKLDLNTEGKLVVMDTTGKQIPNPKTAGTFMAWNEVVESEAIKADLYEKNPHAGQRPTFVPPTGQPTPPMPPQGGQRQPFIHPAAMR